jgi:hypothetical protein
MFNEAVKFVVKCRVRVLKHQQILREIPVIKIITGLEVNNSGNGQKRRDYRKNGDTFGTAQFGALLRCVARCCIISAQQVTSSMITYFFL